MPSEDLANEMRRLPLVPGDVVESLEAAFSAAAKANQLVLWTNECTAGSSLHARITRELQQAEAEFHDAWTRAAPIVLAGNWPQKH